MGHKNGVGSSLRGITMHIVHPKQSNESQSSKGKAFSLVVKTLCLILFYYIFSIGLTFYNKWMFKRFHYPLMTTCLHFLFVFVYCGTCRILCTRCRENTPTLSWTLYLKKVFITGFASALDIGLSNWSFVFITVSLYTMVKSTAVIFILGFSLILKLEKPRWSLIIVVGLISGGLFLFVFESTQFNPEGFILVLTASFLGGIRWTLSQILTQKKELNLTNPIDLTYHLTPTMFVGLFPLALAHEGLPFFSSSFLFASETVGEMVPALLMILVGGILAFLLSVSEYLLLSSTSSLTLSICGIFKEIATLLLDSTYNGSKFTAMNWVGFLICISGIGCHVYLKYKHSQDESPSKSSSTEEENVQLSLLKNINLDSDSESENEIFNINHR
uniref:Solute carrier family 35 member C2 n=1 Tax=Phallusia mammillata TaxID=59560 RepID=A0A6F9DSY0_9ASCI|nr:solute carrier family 35 member C2 [Phallusia mammillata]